MRNVLLFSALLASAKDQPKGGSGGGAPETKAAPTQTAPTSAATLGADGPTNEIDNEGVEMLRKISPATVIGQFKKPKKPLTDDKGQPLLDEKGAQRFAGYAEDEIWPDTPLYAVIGVTHGTKTGTSDNGPWVSFLGAFEATRFSDGQRFQGGQCFVPKAVEDIMVATLNATQRAQGAAGGIAAIEFGIEVGVRHAKTATGYEYIVKNLVKTQGTDPLAMLRGKVRGVLGNRLPAMTPAALPPAAMAPALPAK